MAKDARHFKGEMIVGGKRNNLGILTVCAIGCVVVVLTMGFFFISSRPAIRIVLLTAMSIFSIVSLWVWSQHHDEDPNRSELFIVRVFPIVLFCLGMSYLLFFPPGTIPDEGYHFGASYEYANLFEPDMDTREMRKEDADFVTDKSLFSVTLSPSFWKAQKEGLSLIAEDTSIVFDEDAIKTLKMPQQINFSNNTPQTKIPAALGIELSRLLGLSGVATFFMGRFFNFMWSFAMLVAAVILTPIGKKTFISAALMPMTLHLLGSYSYDGSIIGLSFLLTALLLKLLLGSGRASRGLLVSSLATAVLLAPCKVVYLLLVTLAMAIPTSRFQSKKAMIIWKTSMLVLPAISLLLFSANRLIRFSGLGKDAGTVDTRGEEEGRFYALSDIVAHPFGSLTMLLRTLFYNIDFYTTSLVGGSLAWFQPEITAQSVQVFLLVFVLFLSSLRSEEDNLMLSIEVRVLISLIVLAGFLGITLSMWMGWTFVTENMINGVQGRYLIPFLPMALLALRGKSISASNRLDETLTMVLAGFNFLYLAQITFLTLGG